MAHHALAMARGLVAADATGGTVDLDTMRRIVDADDAPVLEPTFSGAVALVSSARK